MTIATRCRPLGAACLLGAACVLPAMPANADAVGDFYKGKSIALIISVGVGDGMDLTARILARHWKNHIPGQPNIIPKNMTGAGHLRATNFLYDQSPQDGTTLGAIIPVFVMNQLLDRQSVAFDAAKFNWIGSSNASNAMVFVWHTTGVKTLQDAMQKEVIMGGSGAGSNSVIYPAVLNNVLGTKFKVVMGYKSTPEIDIAMERGEVQSRSGGSYSGIANEHPDWIKEKKVRFLMQVGGEREKDLPDVPLMSELAANEDQRQILRLLSSPVALGRPFLTTPKIPSDRLAALRRAFDATMADKEFLAEATKLNLDLNPINGERVAAIVDETVNIPKSLLDRAKAAMQEAEPGGGDAKTKSAD